jgi:hypothetical protein
VCCGGAQLASTHAHADCERLLRDRERDAVQLTAALRGGDGKRVLALLSAHPHLVQFVDSTGKNILHVCWCVAR